MTREKTFRDVLDALADEDSLRLERPYAADVLLVPPVIRLDGEWLSWRLRRSIRTNQDRLRAMSQQGEREFGGYRVVQPGPRLLRDFVALADAEDRHVLAYAQRWGVLGICRHGMPSCHNGPFEASDGCYPIDWDGGAAREPLAAWRSHAKRARTYLRAASRLRQDGRGLTAEEVTVITHGTIRDIPGLSASESWEALRSGVNFWLKWGAVQPQLVQAKPAERPKLVLAPAWMALKPHLPLFGALGIQLAFAIASERGWAWCSACGSPYEPTRLPAAGRDTFCRNCGRPAATRAASARYRQKARAKAPDKPARGHLGGKKPGAKRELRNKAKPR